MDNWPVTTGKLIRMGPGAPENHEHSMGNSEFSERETSQQVNAATPEVIFHDRAEGSRQAIYPG